MADKYKTETSAGGIVYKKSDGIFYWLLVQHASAKHWGFPKGHVGDKIPNEKMEEAALREVYEEGGIKAQIVSDTPATTTYFYRLHGTLMKKTVYYFLMEHVSGKTEDHDEEVTEAVYVPDDKVIEAITYDSDAEAFMKVKRMVRLG